MLRQKDLKILREYYDIYIPQPLRDFDDYDFIADISILHYYGQYGNCYVVQIIDAYADFPAVESECVVAGIVVKYSGPHIIVWERTDFEY